MTNLVDSKVYLEGLIQEISQTDPAMFNPTHAPEKGQKLIAVVDDEFSKKVFSLAMFYRREARRLQVDMEVAGVDIHGDSQFQMFKSKSDLLLELLWVLLRSRYNHWHTGIGIRQGWEMVSLPADDEAKTVIMQNLPKFLKRLMEDQDE
jgi:hypothetical protein